MSNQCNNKLITIGHRTRFIFCILTSSLVEMVKLFRAADAEEMARTGYSAKYIADIKFRKSIPDSGFIWVTIPAGTVTAPHAHAELQEAFVALTALSMHVDDRKLHLELGDIVLVDPGEKHSFSASKNSESSVLAIKFPNLKNDKIESHSSKTNQ